jgi:hypothetical protein
MASSALSTSFLKSNPPIVSPKNGENKSATSSPQSPDEMIEHIIKLCKTITKSVDRNRSVTKEDKDSIKSSANSIDETIKLLKSTLSNHDSTTTASDTSSVRDIIREELLKFREDLAFPRQQQQQQSFASITASTTSTKKVKAPKSRPAIIIESSHANIKSSQDVIEVFRKKVSFKDSNFAPAKVQPVSNNKVRIEFDNVQQQKETLRKIATVQKIKAEEAKKVRPLIILKGITNDVKSEEVPELIKVQNPSVACNSEEDLKVRFLRRNKKDTLYNVVLEVSPEVRVQILGLGKVNVDHQRIHVEDFSSFMQCFKCLQFGHTKTKCTSENKVCSHCASTEHTFKECPDKEDPLKLKCCNCHSDNIAHKKYVDALHSATSVKNCPQIKSMIKRINARTDYGN